MAIVTRAGKGSALTHNEMDTNLTDLRDGLNLMVPRSSSSGIKIDSLGTPSFGWKDVYGNIHTASTGPGSPGWNTYFNNLKQLQYAINDETVINYTLPHDIVLGQPIYVFVAWSHNSALVTGGSVTWVFERTYAKSYNQMPFQPVKSLTFTQNASTVQYQLMEMSLQGFIDGGDATRFNTADLEPGGMVMGRLYLSANNLTVSGGGVPQPFLHRIGIHYQSRQVGTKTYDPPFYGA